MNASAVLALLREIAANLPPAITTGLQVIQLVNDAYLDLQEAFEERAVPAGEIEALVKRIVANSAAIQAIE